MALRYSIGTGNWSDPTKWDGGVAVPANTDTVEIRNGHTITIDAEIAAIGTCTIKSGGILKPGFAMATSAFANIVIDSGGKLYASRTATSKLRRAGTITGAGEIDYGKETTDPIPIGIAACIEAVCTSDNQASRDIVLSANNTLFMCGATRVKSSTLSALASIGANTIVLAEDMALRPGTLAQALDGLADFIVVGHTPTHTDNGAQNDEIDIYLVAGYNAGTKTVTLGDAGSGQTYWPRGGVTATWNTIHQTDRQIGTPVYLLGANVVLRGSDYNLRPASGVSGNFAATIKKSLILWSSLALNGGYHTISACMFAGNGGGTSSGTCTISDCLFIGNGAGVNLGTHTISACVFAGNTNGINYGTHTISACVFAGTSSGINYGNCTISLCAFSGNYYGINYGAHTIVSCSFSGNILCMAFGIHTILSCSFIGGNRSGIGYGIHTLADCTGIGTLYYLSVVWNAHIKNCLFSGVEFNGYNSTDRRVYHYVDSVDHNGTPGAFKAWCRGGIVTKAANVIPSGKSFSYEHACESATSPVFRQLEYMLKPYESIHYRADVRKAIAMAYLPRIQILDYFADPLVDAANVPLASASMTDSIDTWEALDVYYFNNSNMPKKILLRTLAMNATGIVYFYPSIILNSDNIVTCDSEGAV